MSERELLRRIATEVERSGSMPAPPGVHEDYAQGRKDFALLLAHIMDEAGYYPATPSPAGRPE